jgi:hypothetical protein
MNPKEAAHAHMTWVADLWDRIQNDDPIDPAETGGDDRCEMGRWLKEQAPACAGLPEFETLRRLHGEYHACAMRAVVQARAGRKDEALRTLEMGGTCTEISTILVDACFVFLSSRQAP